MSGYFREPSAPRELWPEGIQHIVQYVQDSHFNASFPQLAARLFQQVMNEGYGSGEVSALFKMLQKGS